MTEKALAERIIVDFTAVEFSVMCIHLLVFVHVHVVIREMVDDGMGLTLASRMQC